MSTCSCHKLLVPHIKPLIGRNGRHYLCLVLHRIRYVGPQGPTHGRDASRKKFQAHQPAKVELIVAASLIEGLAESPQHTAHSVSGRLSFVPQPLTQPRLRITASYHHLPAFVEDTRKAVK